MIYSLQSRADNCRLYYYDGSNRYTIEDRQTIQVIVHVNSKGDTIRSERKTYVSDARRYYGSFEQHGTSWIYHTPAGYIDLANGNHYYFAKDYQGSTRAVYTHYTRPVIGPALPFAEHSTYALNPGDLQLVTHTLKQRMAYYPSGLPVNIYEDDAVTDRLHLGKPWLNLDGAGLYNNSARLHDAIAGTFITPDPLAHKYTSISSYTMCLGNVIKYIDLDGKRPTDYEAALMCSMVYKDENYSTAKDILMNKVHNWKISDIGNSLKLNHSSGESIGLQSMLFEKEVNGVKEYAYVFAGTNCWEDGVEDFTQLFGITAQYSPAIENARKIAEMVGVENLTLLGHSLGGALATAGSMATGCDAITFNTAVISPLTKLILGLEGSGSVTNFISSTPLVDGDYKFVDPITVVQHQLFLRPPGELVPIVTGLTPSHAINDIVNGFQNAGCK